MSLAENKLEEEGTKAICEALEQNKTLTELDISGYHSGSYIGGSAGAKHVAKMLGVNGTLTKMKYVTFRSAPSSPKPSSHILPLTLPTALCNLTARPLLPSVCVQP